MPFTIVLCSDYNASVCLGNPAESVLASVLMIARALLKADSTAQWKEQRVDNKRSRVRGFSGYLPLDKNGVLPISFCRYETVINGLLQDPKMCLENTKQEKQKEKQRKAV